MSFAATRRFITPLLLLLPIAALAQSAFTNQPVNVRAGPDHAFPLVSWLPAGTPVTVVGCTNGWRWCDIVSGWRRGWVHSHYLSGPVRSLAPVITFSVGPYWGAHYRGRPWYSQQPGWNNWGSPSFRPPPPLPRPPVVRPTPPRPPVTQPIAPPRPPAVRPPSSSRPPIARPPQRPTQPGDGPPNLGPPPVGQVPGQGGGTPRPRT